MNAQVTEEYELHDEHIRREITITGGNVCLATGSVDSIENIALLNIDM
jgi:hypothetical protein